jgi:hypothetical protein
MSAAYPETRTVPVDVLPPVPKDMPLPPKETVPFEGLKTFYHPASGVVILGLDWLIFGTDFVSDFLATPIMCVLGFMVTFALVLAIQVKWGKNPIPTALWKSFLGAFLVAIPLPITGTILGAAILALSGLPHHPVDAVKQIIDRNKAKSS